MCSNDFEKQLQVVESLENWLKDSFPNKMFCSYFLYSETMASKFCFHMECPNMDWLSDKKVKSSNDCIRKNIFWYAIIIEKLKNNIFPILDSKFRVVLECLLSVSNLSGDWYEKRKAAYNWLDVSTWFLFKFMVC